jgi:hypothetical protein
LVDTADPIAILEARAREIRERIEPQRQAIRDDEEQLARIEAAVAMLRGEIAVGVRPAVRSPSPTMSERTAPRRRRGGRKQAIFEYLREQPGASAAQVAEALGGSKPSVTSTLQKMASDGDLEKQKLGGRSVGFILAR